jgi:hypothetical protein
VEGNIVKSETAAGEWHLRGAAVTPSRCRIQSFIVGRKHRRLTSTGSGTQLALIRKKRVFAGGVCASE